MVLAAAVVLTGCSAKFGGLPMPGKGAGAPAITAEVLGDLRTVEPCTLTDPGVFSRFGPAEFGTPESLDYCSVSIRPDTSTEVLVMVGQLGRLSDDPGLAERRLEDVDDGVYRARANTDVALCSEALVFAADDLTLTVAGTTYSGAAENTCEMVAAGMDKVVEVVEKGGVGHRFPEPDSLVMLDPCELVPEGTVTALPGFAAATRQDNPGRHQCSWGAPEGADRLRVTVVFGAGSSPKVYGGAVGSNTDPIAGRPTVTNPFPGTGDSSFCRVETGHIAFTEFEEHLGMVEVASVYSRAPAGQVRAACQAATAVAAVVWPRLPPA